MVDTVSRPTNQARVQYRNGAGRKSRSTQLTPEQQSIASARTSWENGTVDGLLKRLPERVGAEDFTTISGQPINRIYTPADLAGFDYNEDLGFPGEYPFTRGV